MTTWTVDEMKKRVLEDDDFVALKRFEYSMKNLMARYPDGVPNDRIIAQAMMLTEDELTEVYDSIVEKLKKGFGE